MNNTEENFIVYDICNNIKYQSKDYSDFIGKNLNHFIKYCINSKFDLSYVNLSYANLSYVNLSYANLYNANLYNADLYNANLSYVNLRGANLYNANLYNANLENANLENANLYKINLSYANLENANLKNTDLKNTNLENVNLENANLRGANLKIYCKWNILYKINENKEIIITIGCKEKTIEDWDYFFSNKCTEKFETERNTIEFKQIHAMYDAYKAYLKKMELI